MKYKKIMALVVAVITITMAFAPAAMAVTYAPYSWSQWPLQKQGSYNTMFTKAVQRYCNRAKNSGLTIDGVYGDKTYLAVRSLQVKLGFTGTDVDGKVGSDTWTAMFGDMSRNTNPNATAYFVKKIDGTYDTISSYLWTSSGKWQTSISTSNTSNYYADIVY